MLFLKDCSLYFIYTYLVSSWLVDLRRVGSNKNELKSGEVDLLNDSLDILFLIFVKSKHN